MKFSHLEFLLTSTFLCCDLPKCPLGKRYEDMFFVIITLQPHYC